MSLNLDYEKIRTKSLNGYITRELFPYLFEYYKDHANIPALNDYNNFVTHFVIYLNTPVIYVDGSIRQPVEELKLELNKIFTHLNKKYEEEEPTE